MRIVGGRDGSTVPRDPTMSTIEWIHSVGSRTNSHVSGAAIRIQRFGDEESGSRITGDMTDIESMKPINKVRLRSFSVRLLLTDQYVDQ